MTDKKEISIKSQHPANVLQCAVCGQIVASTNPENLRRVCLACCPRIKANAPETPYISYTELFPVEVIHCIDREQQQPETTADKGACQCSR